VLSNLYPITHGRTGVTLRRMAYSSSHLRRLGGSQASLPRHILLLEPRAPSPRSVQHTGHELRYTGRQECTQECILGYMYRKVYTHHGTPLGMVGDIHPPWYTPGYGRRDIHPPWYTPGYGRYTPYTPPGYGRHTPYTPPGYVGYTPCTPPGYVGIPLYTTRV